MRYLSALIGRMVLAFALMVCCSAGTAYAATAKEMRGQAQAALSRLYKASPAAGALSKKINATNVASATAAATNGGPATAARGASIR